MMQRAVIPCVLAAAWGVFVCSIAVAGDKPAPATAALISPATRPAGDVAPVRPFHPDRLTRKALLGDTAFRQTSRVDAMVLSADEKQIISAGSIDDSLHVWDAATGKELRRIDMPANFSLYSLRFLPGGKRLVFASTSAGESQITLWDLEAGAARQTIHDQSFRSIVAVSPDGGQVFARDNVYVIMQIDMKTGREVRRWKCPEKRGQLFCASDVTPDGKRLVTFYKSILIWDVASGELLHEINDLADCDPRGLTMDPTSRLAVVDCQNGTLAAWDVTTGKRVWVNDLGWQGRALFTPDGKTLVVRAEKQLLLLDAATGKPTSHIDLAPAEAFWPMTFSADGARVYGCIDNTLAGYDLAAGKRLFPAETKGQIVSGPVEHLAASADGSTLYSGTREGPVLVWDVTGGTVRETWDIGKGVRSLNLSPDGQRLLAGNADSQAFILDPATGKKVCELANPAKHYWQLPCWAQGGRSIVGLAYAEVDRHDLHDGTQSILHLWQGDQPKPRSFEVPSGSHNMGCGGGPRWKVSGSAKDWVAVAGNDHMGISYVYFIRLDTGEVLAEAKAKFGYVQASAMGPGNRTWVMLSQTGQLFQWTPAEGSVPKPEPADLARAVKQLAADDFDTREAAASKLIAAGEDALPFLERADVSEPEVKVRLPAIRMGIIKAQFPQRLVGQLRLTGTSSLGETEQPLALHPDGRHWAAVPDHWHSPEIVLGELTDHGPVILRRIEDRANGPVSVHFSADGAALFVGNANTTISVYAEPVR